MSLPATRTAQIPSMSDSAVAKVRAFENVMRRCKEVLIATHHLIHAGIYARTITIPADVVLTGVLIKRATILILNGDATVATGEESVRLTGYHVLPASAHRKQAFIAHTDTQLTMLFPSAARTVEEAEAEFTDETHLLLSRRAENFINITKE